MPFILAKSDTILLVKWHLHCCISQRGGSFNSDSRMR